MSANELLKSLFEKLFISFSGSDRRSSVNLFREILARIGLLLSENSLRHSGKHGESRVLIMGFTRFMGKGTISYSGKVHFAVDNEAPFTGVLIEARNSKSSIAIGDGFHICNGSTIISENTDIVFGCRVLIGSNFFCADSNFHDLRVSKRLNVDPKPIPVSIGDDVFIGRSVTILKGAQIGMGSVISAGSVLPPRFTCDPKSIVAGNPARVIGTLVADEAQTS